MALDKTIELKGVKVTFKKLTFIETMGVKRIIEPLIHRMYNKEKGDALTKGEVRDRFYSQTAEQLQDIVNVFKVAIQKIGKKTKLTETDINDLLSKIDIDDIMFIVNSIYNGSISFDDKKK